jgi:hypothetical protein
LKLQRAGAIGIHQHRRKGQALVSEHVGQPISDMIKLALAIAVSVTNSKIDHPMRVDVGVDVHAI